MKLSLVGVGELGSRAVESILDEHADTNKAFAAENALVCDISRTPLSGIENVPEAHRVLIGDTHHLVSEDGIDGGPDLAADATQEDLPELRRAFDSIAVHESDAVLVVTALGDAVGAGAGSVLVEELEATYDEPVYVLGILPADAMGNEQALAAARGLRTVVPLADSTLLFDGEAWNLTSMEDDEAGDDTASALQSLATRIVLLFGAGEREVPTIAENAMDSSDIIRTLAPGGIASIGYASAPVQTNSRGILARILSWLGRTTDSPGPTDAAKIKSLVQQAANSRLTIPADIESTERAMIVLSGPPSELSRRGFESARQWLEQETDTVEILAGDDPRPRASKLEVVVLFSNVTTVPQIDALQERAVAQKRQQTADESMSWPHD